MKPVTAFKVALLEALKADSSVAAIVAGRVFDVPPRDARNLPSDVADGAAYCYLGPLNAVREAEDCGDRWRVTARIYAVSFQLGRDEAWSLNSAIEAALENVQLSMSTGGHSPGLWPVQSGDVVDPIMPVMTYVDVTTYVHA